MRLLKEFCAENAEHVASAIKAGAQRIELCDNLAVGGTSPSYGVIRAAVELAHERGANVMAMVRPRGGNFVYTLREAQMMFDDIEIARKLGADGVVFGCLRASEPAGTMHVDRELTARLADAAQSGPSPAWATFHMAFDELDTDAQLEAIDFLASLGVQRILTHGGAAGTPIENNLKHLKALVAHSAGRITILPGGGITYKNAEKIAAAIGVTEVHGTRIVHM